MLYMWNKYIIVNQLYFKEILVLEFISQSLPLGEPDQDNQAYTSKTFNKAGQEYYKECPL